MEKVKRGELSDNLVKRGMKGIEEQAWTTNKTVGEINLEGISPRQRFQILLKEIPNLKNQNAACDRGERDVNIYLCKCRAYNLQ